MLYNSCVAGVSSKQQQLADASGVVLTSSDSGDSGGAFNPFEDMFSMMMMGR